jgi:ribosomal protein S18 acetylase RimI-like enzyme
LTVPDRRLEGLRFAGTGEGDMAGLENVEVRPIEGEELRTAALVAARGMRDNPLHVAAIGSNPERRVRVMHRVFSRLLTLPGRPTLGAWDGDRLVGVADSAEPGRCQPSPRDRLRVAPAMLMAGTAAPRMGRWLSTWAKHDPDRQHSHFGPLAVDIDLQGRGIGTLLLAAYCQGLDDAGVLAYLETDKAENVRLYERFGFVVTAEADVIGVKSWFMTREALPPESD